MDNLQRFWPAYARFSDVKDRLEDKIYTEFDPISFAAYRASFADQSKDSYKNIEECLSDWKEMNNHN